MRFVSLRRTSSLLVLCSGLALVVSSSAFAQDKAKSTVKETEGTPAVEAQTEKDSSAIFAGANLPKVDPSKFLPMGEKSIQEMRTALRLGLDTLRQAREAKDAVRLNCVNDRITAMKGIMKISEDAYIALQEAMATNAIENARYEFGKIRVSQQKMKDLRTQAENCAGAEATFSGGTEIEVEEEASPTVTETYYDPSTSGSFFNETTSTEAVSSGVDDGLNAEPVAGSETQVGGGIDARPPVSSVAEEDSSSL